MPWAVEHWHGRWSAADAAIHAMGLAGKRRGKWEQSSFGSLYKTCQDVLAGYAVLYSEKKSLDHSSQFDKTSPINFPDGCSMVVAAENGVNSLSGC